jgi:TetR/AcrR family transcriptional regulator
MADAPIPSRDPASARRGLRAGRTRAAILESAERLFAERGFSAARLEDVAEAVGIRRASLFYYFRDKAELYDAVLADVLGSLRERLASVLLGAGPLAERAEAAVSAWIDFVAARPAFARLLLREVADGSPAHEPPLARHVRPFFELVGRVLAEPGDPLARAAPVDPVNLASVIAGSTVFFVAAMPTLLPGLHFDPLQPERIEAHRREVLGIARRLLGSGES